jgi:hypothetical protein
MINTIDLAPYVGNLQDPDLDARLQLQSRFPARATSIDCAARHSLRVRPAVGLRQDTVKFAGSTMSSPSVPLMRQRIMRLRPLIVISLGILPSFGRAAVLIWLVVAAFDGLP